MRRPEKAERRFRRLGQRIQPRRPVGAAAPALAYALRLKLDRCARRARATPWQARRQFDGGARSARMDWYGEGGISINGRMLAEKDYLAGRLTSSRGHGITKGLHVIEKAILAHRCGRVKQTRPAKTAAKKRGGGREPASPMSYRMLNKLWTAEIGIGVLSPASAFCLEHVI